MESKQVEVLVESNRNTTEIQNRYIPKNTTKPIESAHDYLDEYDNYYFEHEKYFQAGHGGKQRNKKEVAQNSGKHDPSGNVRIIVNKMQNFEHNRRKPCSP